MSGASDKETESSWLVPLSMAFALGMLSAVIPALESDSFSPLLRAYLLDGTYQWSVADSSCLYADAGVTLAACFLSMSSFPSQIFFDFLCLLLFCSSLSAVAEEHRLSWLAVSLLAGVTLLGAVSVGYFSFALGIIGASFLLVYRFRGVSIWVMATVCSLLWALFSIHWYMPVAILAAAYALHPSRECDAPLLGTVALVSYLFHSWLLGPFLLFDIVFSSEPAFVYYASLLHLASADLHRSLGSVFILALSLGVHVWLPTARNWALSLCFIGTLFFSALLPILAFVVCVSAFSSERTRAPTRSVNSVLSLSVLVFAFLALSALASQRMFSQPVFLETLKQASDRKIIHDWASLPYLSMVRLNTFISRDPVGNVRAGTGTYHDSIYDDYQALVNLEESWRAVLAHWDFDAAVLERDSSLSVALREEFGWSERQVLAAAKPISLLIAPQ